jgi:hypothetical protein
MNMHSNGTNDQPNRLSRRGFLGMTAGGALTISAASLIAACSQPAAAPSGGGAAAPAAAPTAKPAAPAAAAGQPTPVPTPEVAQIGSGSKTAIFWHGLGGADGKTMQTMLNDYA